MLTNINLNQMNQLMAENSDAKQIISQLLENHHYAVSMIAHEIRNPLTLVSSSLQMIESLHPEVKDYHGWDQVLDDIQFMCDLLTDLTSFNRSHMITHSVFSIEQLLRNIAVSFAISLDSEDSDIEFTSCIAPDMGDFTGDKIKLEEVFLNILRNAKDAVSETGSIFFSAKRMEDRIVIQCTDDGCGISDEIIDTIFSPFVTYKEGGTGLGLALSKRIVESHGGTISASSSSETGTVFTVELPV